MASIGLTGFWIAPYIENATHDGYSYEGRKKVAKAVEADVSYTVAEASFYADNAKDDEVRAVTGVDVTLTPNDVSIDWEEELGLADTTVSINGEDVEVRALRSDTESGFRGLAYIENTRESGTEKYAVRFFPKVKFHPADSRNTSTKGESISFNTQTIVATGFADVKGNLELFPKNRFATEALAVTYIEGLFGIGTSGNGGLGG